MRSKYFFPLILLFLVGCSDDADLETLEKDSVVLGSLDNHDVTYENTVGGARHTDRYCPSGDLRDSSNAANGVWSENGTILTTNPTVGTAYNYTTTGMLEKSTIYSTDKVDMFRVVRIVETSC